MVKNLLNLFFPKSCLACDQILNDNELEICCSCRHNLPFLNSDDLNPNPIEKILLGRVKIKYGTALFRFHKNGIVQNLLHNLKYRGHKEIGELFAHWLGKTMIENPQLSERIDIIIPVPLHSRKKRFRGYNQVEKFGLKLAKYLNAEYSDSILIKENPTRTQVFKKRGARWMGKQSGFKIINENKISQKHVLLVDDLITTGSTIEACINELSKNNDVQISVATMAIAD